MLGLSHGHGGWSILQPVNAGKIVAQQLITAAGGLALVGIFIFLLNYNAGWL